MKRTLALAAGLAAALALPARAQNCSVQADYFSTYLARGLVYQDVPSLQITPTCAYKGVSASFFNNVDLQRGQWNEWDLFLDYTKKVGKVNLSLRFNHLEFNYPEFPDFHHTSEVGAAVSLETILRPTLTVYRDIDIINQTYAEASVTHTAAGFTGTAMLSFGNYFAPSTGINHLEFKLARTFTSGKLSVTPNISILRGLNSNFQNHTKLGVQLNF